MTIVQSTPEAFVWVAIDVAKDHHETLIEAPGWRSRKRIRVQNRADDFRSFANFLHSLRFPVRIGFEPTSNYHRALAYFLHSEGFSLEEVVGDLHAPVLGSVVLASATSWAMLRLLSGQQSPVQSPAI